MVSTTLEGPLDWPDATIVRGDAVDVLARLKEESEVPLRSDGSLSMNRALMAAGPHRPVQLTIFPVITGRTGSPCTDFAAVLGWNANRVIGRRPSLVSRVREDRCVLTRADDADPDLG